MKKKGNSLSFLSLLSPLFSQKKKWKKISFSLSLSSSNLLPECKVHKRRHGQLLPARLVLLVREVARRDLLGSQQFAHFKAEASRQRGVLLGLVREPAQEGLSQVSHHQRCALVPVETFATGIEALARPEVEGERGTGSNSFGNGFERGLGLVQGQVVQQALDGRGAGGVGPPPCRGQVAGGALRVEHVGADEDGVAEESGSGGRRRGGRRGRRGGRSGGSVLDLAPLRSSLPFGPQLLQQLPLLRGHAGEVQLDESHPGPALREPQAARVEPGRQRDDRVAALPAVEVPAERREHRLVEPARARVERVAAPRADRLGHLGVKPPVEAEAEVDGSEERGAPRHLDVADLAGEVVPGVVGLAALDVGGALDELFCGGG